MCKFQIKGLMVGLFDQRLLNDVILKELLHIVPDVFISHPLIKLNDLWLVPTCNTLTAFDYRHQVLEVV